MATSVGKPSTASPATHQSSSPMKPSGVGGVMQTPHGGRVDQLYASLCSSFMRSAPCRSWSVDTAHTRLRLGRLGTTFGVAAGRAGVILRGGGGVSNGGNLIGGGRLPRWR